MVDDGLEELTVDYLVVGIGLFGTLRAAELAIQGAKVLNVGCPGQLYGGQHCTVKGIDTCPLLLTPKGRLSERLIKCHASEYLSFRPVHSIHVIFPSGAIKVPFRKEHVMLESGIHLHDKRRLMRLFTGEETEIIDDGLSANEFLGRTGLSDTVIDMILYGVCNLPDRDSGFTAKDLFGRISVFYNSLPQPLLYPIHGASEISQSLARVAAVYGAVQVLNQPDPLHILYDGRTIGVRYNATKEEFDQGVHDCQVAFLATESTLHCESGVHLYVYPPNGEYQKTMFVLQLDSTTACCPAGKHLLYLLAFSSDAVPFKERVCQLLQASQLGTDMIAFKSIKTMNKSFVY